MTEFEVKLALANAPLSYRGGARSGVRHWLLCPRSRAKVIGVRPSRICLITPGQLALNPRLVKEADALSAAGYEVSVICTSYLDWAMQHDASFEREPWQIAARIPFGPLAPSGIRIKQVIRQRSARVALAIGLGSRGRA